MDIKPIRTDEDYRAALREVESLMSTEFGTPEGDRLDVLAILVEAYEARQYPMDLPSPIDAIKFSMEQKGALAQRPEADDRSAQSGVRNSQWNAS